MTLPDDSLLTSRKSDHLALTEGGRSEGARRAGWDDVHLIHEPLPEIDFGRIDLTTEFLGRRLAAPVLISGMTGGPAAAGSINRVLARAAESLGIAMGVGSQRAMLRHPADDASFRVAREAAPTAFLLANIGAPQLIDQGGVPRLTLAQVTQLIDAIGANALAIHLNFLQEAVQSEGDRNAAGCLAAIRALCDQVSVPVLTKETGAGMRATTARRLIDVGVQAIDVGGLGGTNFARVEGERAAARGDVLHQAIGETFAEWGIPTAVSVSCCGGIGVPVVATGQVRTGLDAAKALALGARLVGVGRPLLDAALQGEGAVEDWLARFLEELRTALFLTGCSTPSELRHHVFVTGETREWLERLTELDRVASSATGSSPP